MYALQFEKDFDFDCVGLVLIRFTGMDFDSAVLLFFRNIWSRKDICVVLVAHKRCMM
jgi:hypothetical protein